VIARIITGLSAGAAYAIVAVGVVLIFKGTKALSVAQGEIGAFGFFLALRWADRGIPGVRWHVPRFATLLIAIVIGALVGALVERVVMRPLVTRPPLDALIATLGIALFLALLEKEMFGTATQFAPSPVGEWKLEVFGTSLTAPRVIAIVAVVVVAIAVWLFLNRTKFGLAVLATTGDPVVARVLGVPVNRVYRFTWVAAGLLAGLAAALLGPAFGGLTPFDMTRFSLRALAGAVIGGLDSVWGAIVGCLAIGVLEGVVGGSFSTAGAPELAVLALVLATLLLRPRGLLGAEGAA
jgi:branched-chain amino acid transport system permease protein